MKLLLNIFAAILLGVSIVFGVLWYNDPNNALFRPLTYLIGTLSGIVAFIANNLNPERKRLLKFYLEDIKRFPQQRNTTLFAHIIKSTTKYQLEEERKDVYSLLNKPGNKILIGDMGSGKTTILKVFSFNIANKGLKKKLPIPIYIDLKKLKRKSQLFDLLIESFEERIKGKSENKFSLILNERPHIIMLDGLNEVKVDFQDDAFIEIAQFCKRYEHKNVKFIVTSRKQAIYKSLAKEFDAIGVHYEILELEPLTIKQINTILRGNSSNIETSRLHDYGLFPQKLQEFVSNPLMLEIIVPNIPKLLTNTQINQALIIQEFIENKVNYGKIDRIVKECVLPKITTFMIQKGIASLELNQNQNEEEIEIASFIVNSCREENKSKLVTKNLNFETILSKLKSSGLLIGDNALDFINQKFLFYFASIEIRNIFLQQNKIEGKNIKKENWQDLIIISAGLFNNKAKTSLFVEFIGKSNINLAGKCIVEGGANVTDNCKINIYKKLKAASNNPKLKIENRIKSGDLAGRIDDRFLWNTNKKIVPKLVSINECIIKIGVTKKEKEKILDQFPSYPLNTFYFEITNQKKVKPFLISKYPITYSQFSIFIKSEGYQKKRFWSTNGIKWLNSKLSGFSNKEIKNYRPPYFYDSRFNEPTRPIIGLNYYEAEAYCNWLTSYCKDDLVFNLPSEDQWEIAARWKSLPLKNKRHYCFTWGDKFMPSKLNCFNEKSSDMVYTSPVGIFNIDENQQPSDLLGNVWEMCLKENNDKDFVCRGGSWNTDSAYTYIGYKSTFVPEKSFVNLGFRIVGFSSSIR